MKAIYSKHPTWKRTCTGTDLRNLQNLVNLANLSELNINEIMQIIRSHPKPRAAYLLMTHYLHNQGLNDIVNLISVKLPKCYSGLNLAERFASISIWHQTLISQLSICDDSKQISSYPKKHKKQQLSSIANCLFFLNSEHNSFLINFFNRCTIENVKELLKKYANSRKVMNNRIKSQRYMHHARPAVTVMLRLFRNLKKLKYINCDLDNLNIADILQEITNKRQVFESRRELTDDEMQKIIENAESHLEILILTLLREIGLRVSSISHLTYLSLLSDNHKPKNECIVLEKMQTRRFFITSLNLKSKINIYAQHFRNHHPEIRNFSDVYLLNIRHPERPLPTATIRRLLKRLTLKAKIYDINIHPHMFRHTIVGKLMEAGNSIEIVSKFMGHKNVKTTADNYWVTDNRKILASIKNPFAEGFFAETDDLQTLTDMKLDKSLEILHKILNIVSKSTEENLMASDVQKKILQISNLQEQLEIISDDI